MTAIFDQSASDPERLAISVDNTKSHLRTSGSPFRPSVRHCHDVRQNDNVIIPLYPDTECRLMHFEVPGNEKAVKGELNKSRIISLINKMEVEDNAHRRVCVCVCVCCLLYTSDAADER